MEEKCEGDFYMTKGIIEDGTNWKGINCEIE